ncbi:MAG: 2-amino-4-hydroxy-6-hydroxymethyldihydropteridine diphosphokinase [Bacteroidota bacterium]|nr:2-amino-4-hydroxy-6-hydroxymethyldihydropteridine diphosphokinase [Bacteroidota bacterium]
MENVFLSLGSNVGTRSAYLQKAVDGIAEFPGTDLVKISSVYQTEPVGVTRQRDFYNAAVWLVTRLDAHEFHARMKTLEQTIGRRRTFRWGPREIDIDILLFGDLVVDEALLRIPHKAMTLRRFVLTPLAEIAPDAIHPVLQETVASLAGRCTDTSAVERLPEVPLNFSFDIRE